MRQAKKAVGTPLVGVRAGNLARSFRNHLCARQVLVTIGLKKERKCTRHLMSSSALASRRQVVGRTLYCFAMLMSNSPFTSASAAMASTISTSGAAVYSSKPAHYVAGSHSYLSIPDDMVLQNVIVVHRHGDRSQIARSLGLNYPEDSAVADVWRTKMPSQASLEVMAAVASSSWPLESRLENPPRTLEDELYSGEDAGSHPYAQLTERGVSQLLAVGRELRSRYVDKTPGFLSDTTSLASQIYARSTNMCRTLQSLRSLLAGFYAIPIAVSSPPPSALYDAAALKNSTRPKKEEVMFPGADGPCDAMATRRAAIFSPDFAERHYPGYAEIEARVKTLLGYQDKVAWLTIKEILTCRREHDIPFPAGISLEDEEKISGLAGWMWGKLYGDTALNRLAIGRFVKELSDDLRAAMGPAPETPDDSSASTTGPRGKKILLYSGHDSTLVPLLCALDIYDGNWPPYASYLTLEIAQSRASGQRFVRALYNDKEVAMLGQAGPWCSFDVLLDGLERFSLRHEDYRKECSQGDKTLLAAAEARAYEAEVKATIGI